MTKARFLTLAAFISSDNESGEKTQQTLPKSARPTVPRKQGSVSFDTIKHTLRNTFTLFVPSL